jgi:hypothetical protein
MENKVKHFRVYRNWVEVFEDMGAEQIGNVFDALMAYAFFGEGEPADDWSPEERVAFYALRASIDVAAEKYGSTTSK